MRAKTFLWFDGCAEDAARHYTTVIPDSAILDRQHDSSGRVTTVEFELCGQHYIAYNGGPGYGSTGAISPYLECAGQDEIDTVWAGLTDGGQPGPGGSLTDRFGITWQVLPTVLADLVAADPDTAPQILTAVHAMTKIEIQTLLDLRNR